MKKYLFGLFMLGCFIASAQKIYVEDMSVVRNALPRIPISIEAIKKACSKGGKTSDCSGVKGVLESTLKFRMDSISIPSLQPQGEMGRIPFMPERPDIKKTRIECLNKSIDSMESLFEKEHILTIKSGKSDYHETPQYGQALKNLHDRLTTPIISNQYYHMNYQEREAYRETIYTYFKIDRAKINYFLAYEKLLFERDKINILEIINISSSEQRKFLEIQSLCYTEIKNLKDSIEKSFGEISDWKTKELAKAKTPAEKTKTNEGATLKHQKVLGSTLTLLISRYAGLTNKIDEQLVILNTALKNYEFGINAISSQEKDLQKAVAQSQLACYASLQSLGDFCVFAHETIIKYSGK